ncbi:hypothetical protein JCM19300_1897 [Algibacter lectus]|uniref:Uncharacterized protein n=1 Tax=Algibacter lectus TaxID=221126 RepID=A0A090VHN7_9FLAO|nr:hypothetical protein JCM19300_1897 [Algibacter lectus]GAL81974.1 hypothetical protein JCM19274_154 [Algibacter lectus]
MLGLDALAEIPDVDTSVFVDLFFIPEQATKIIRIEKSNKLLM